MRTMFLHNLIQVRWEAQNIFFVNQQLLVHQLHNTKLYKDYFELISHDVRSWKYLYLNLLKKLSDIVHL